jgi:hypothetical protein
MAGSRTPLPKGAAVAGITDNIAAAQAQPKADFFSICISSSRGLRSTYVLSGLVYDCCAFFCQTLV